MSDPHIIRSVDQAKVFALAGNATFTLRSQRTGKRFTYKIRRRTPEAAHLVMLLTGPGNESDYKLFGAVRNEQFVFISKPFGPSADAPGVYAFRWFWAKLKEGKIHPELEIWHEGRCGCCGRKLTVPESIASGIGPECSAKLAVPGLLQLLLGD